MFYSVFQNIRRYSKNIIIVKLILNHYSGISFQNSYDTEDENKVASIKYEDIPT